MNVRFYQVDCGDAARVSYKGNDEKLHYIFIDAGYERTYREILANEVKAVEIDGGKIDLWVISHIHDDHIGGAISYIKAIEKDEAKDIVLKWWYNHPYKVIKDASFPIPALYVSEAKSFAQGERLTSYIQAARCLPKFDIVQSNKVVDLNGMKITLLSPTPDALQRLREKYDSVSLGFHEMTTISEPMERVINDYNQKVECFDIEAFDEDISVENNSSISMLTEHDGKKILWLADSFSSTVIDALTKLGYSTKNPLKVDLVKVSHHGSRGNNSSHLYNMIRSDKFMFCGSGVNKHQLPTKECMVRILKNKYRPSASHYEFLFGHDNSSLRSIFDVDGSEIYDILRFKMNFSTSKWVEVNL